MREARRKQSPRNLHHRTRGRRLCSNLDDQRAKDRDTDTDRETDRQRERERERETDAETETGRERERGV